ncbi:ATP-binding protein [Paenibacillus polymyxa]|uniref:ATP-binding protein n=1 Tax=Paenibacillus polymyxa TaxID=1406 RepID=UPI002B40AB45|nr:ATP-binding protein [Paenibacillus polymyxa]URJ46416.2 ATP-binding protein [Paenibacillus polymyxa]
MYCCIKCRQQIKRSYFPPKKQWGLNRACKCVQEESEKAQLESDRRHRRGQMERVFSQSIMNEDLKQASFQTFIPRSGTETAHRAALDFMETYETRKTGLLLYGPTGNGKSHLAAAIHHELNRQGFVCLFLDVPQLLKLAKSASKFNSKFTLIDVINGAVSCDLLTLDELGAGALLEEEYKDVLFPILNGRQGKITNITSNLDLERLEKWLYKDKWGNITDEDGRLFDRIIGSSDIYHNTGTSKRREDAMKRIQQGS